MNITCSYFISNILEQILFFTDPKEVIKLDIVMHALNMHKYICLTVCHRVLIQFSLKTKSCQRNSQITASTYLKKKINQKAIFIHIFQGHVM